MSPTARDLVQFSEITTFTCCSLMVSSLVIDSGMWRNLGSIDKEEKIVAQEEIESEEK